MGLSNPTWSNKNRERALQAVERLDNQQALERVARASLLDAEIKAAALSKIAAQDKTAQFYAYQKPVGAIDDIPQLRSEFIAVFDAKTKADAVRFGLLYGKHLLELTSSEPCTEITDAFAAMQRWLDSTANYHEARNIPFGSLCRTVRAEGNAVKLRLYQTMAQIACIPHVKFHALWASDFAVTLINRMYPGNLDAVTTERQVQITLFASACELSADI